MALRAVPVSPHHNNLELEEGDAGEDATEASSHTTEGPVARALLEPRASSSRPTSSDECSTHSYERSSGRSRGLGRTGSGRGGSRALEEMGSGRSRLSLGLDSPARDAPPPAALGGHGQPGHQPGPLLGHPPGTAAWGVVGPDSRRASSVATSATFAGSSGAAHAHAPHPTRMAPHDSGHWAGADASEVPEEDFGINLIADIETGRGRE